MLKSISSHITCNPRKLKMDRAGQHTSPLNNKKRAIALKKMGYI